MSLLTLKGLAASYGSSKVLFDVNLNIEAGKVTALMGRNGMGKSTTVKAICRMIQSSGQLSFIGQDLHRLASHKVAQLGVGLVPEGRRCFPRLTVQENLIAASRPGEWTLASIGSLFPRLDERRNQKAGSLSGGEQQMLAIGRALMTNPQLLILDEATEGLAPMIRSEIWAAIRTLKTETGLAILVIDKSLKELALVCDDAVIMERGKTVWQNRINELTPEISEKHLGV